MKLDPNFTNSSNAFIRNKKGKIDERSSMLWQRHLWHISKERMQRLIKKGIPYDLDLSDFDTCIDCIKESSLLKLERVKGVKKIKVDPHQH